jgi:hypothetical protein
MGLNRADELEGLVDICESLSDGSAIAACCRLELSRTSGSKKSARLDNARGEEHLVAIRTADPAGGSQ